MLNPPKIILDLHKNKKTEVESHIFKNEFLEIKSNYKHYLSIYTDGSKQDEKVACSVISPNFTDSIRLSAGLGGSVGCAVRLETRRSRVQPPPRSATFFRGD